MTPSQTYDVFLSHSHTDSGWVEQLAAKLEDQAGLSVWLDKWVLVPGELWQSEMARGLDEARCCVVCVGRETAQGWLQQEMQRALDRQTKEPSFKPLLIIKLLPIEKSMGPIGVSNESVPPIPCFKSLYLISS